MSNCPVCGGEGHVLVENAHEAEDRVCPSCERPAGGCDWCWGTGWRASKVRQFYADHPYIETTWFPCDCGAEAK